MAYHSLLWFGNTGYGKELHLHPAACDCTRPDTVHSVSVTPTEAHLLWDVIIYSWRGQVHYCALSKKVSILSALKWMFNHFELLLVPMCHFSKSVASAHLSESPCTVPKWTYFSHIVTSGAVNDDSSTHKILCPWNHQGLNHALHRLRVVFVILL